MPDYKVSPAELQVLNVIVGQQGGVIPTEVSNALAGVQAALANGEYAAAKTYTDQAIAANIKNGAAWSNVQSWHDAVKASGEAPPAPAPTPPPEPAPGPTPPADFSDLKFRLYEIGSWAAFAPPFFKEANALIAASPEQTAAIQQAINYYGPGGYGNVHGRREENDFFYVDITTQEWLPDIDGAADDMILNQPGNPEHVPPPVIHIP